MCTAEQHALRLTVATAVSAALHLALLALVIQRAAPTGDFVSALAEPGKKVELLPVRLVSRPGGGGGGALPGLPSPPKGPPDLPAVAHEAPAPIPRLAAAPRAVEAPTPPPAPRAAIPDGRTTAALRALAPPRTAPAPVARPAAPQAPARTHAAGQPATRAGTERGGAGAVASRGPAGGGSGGRGGGGAGTGDGSGGDGGDALADAAYGTNPKPPYPLAAKRLGVQGVVTLEVLVRADGSPANVRVRSSSGSPLLDDSAVDTVRSKWRFTPARRDNTPVERLVTFPIRFTLDAN